MTVASPKSTHWLNISAFLPSEGAVNDALFDLLNRGIPRDLIEVVVSTQLANQFFTGSRKRLLSLAVSDAAKGALIGLIVFSIISFLLILTAIGRRDDQLISIMVLGPNVGVVLGGLLGLIFGLLRKPRLPQRFKRIQEKELGILMVVRSKSQDESQEILKIFAAHGADEERVEEDPS